jgi:hypothetical protein
MTVPIGCSEKVIFFEKFIPPELAGSAEAAALKVCELALWLDVCAVLVGSGTCMGKPGPTSCTSSGLTAVDKSVDELCAKVTVGSSRLKLANIMALIYVSP